MQFVINLGYHSGTWTCKLVEHNIYGAADSAGGAFARAIAEYQRLCVADFSRFLGLPEGNEDEEDAEERFFPPKAE